jgi:hypothetical protein
MMNGRFFLLIKGTLIPIVVLEVDGYRNIHFSS